MSRDHKSRKSRNKSRDLESRRRSRRRNHSRRNKKSNSDKKSVSRRSRRQRYTVRDEEKPLSNHPLINNQPIQPNIHGGEVQQQYGAPINYVNVPQQTLPLQTNQESVQKIMTDNVQKPPDLPGKQNVSGGSSERLKPPPKRVKRTTPNLSANYNCFTLSSQKIEGKMVHSVYVTTTENIPKKLHNDGVKMSLGNKNILDNFEIQKICKNIKNGVKFGNCPPETIGSMKNYKLSLKTSNDDIIFKTKNDVKLDNRDMFLAKMRSLQDKHFIS